MSLQLSKDTNNSNLDSSVTVNVSCSSQNRQMTGGKHNTNIGFSREGGRKGRGTITLKVI